MTERKNSDSEKWIGMKKKNFLLWTCWFFYIMSTFFESAASINSCYRKDSLWFLFFLLTILHFSVVYWSRCFFWPFPSHLFFFCLFCLLYLPSVPPQYLSSHHILQTLHWRVYMIVSPPLPFSIIFRVYHMCSSVCFDSSSKEFVFACLCYVPFAWKVPMTGGGWVIDVLLTAQLGDWYYPTLNLRPCTKTFHVFSRIGASTFRRCRGSACS